MMNLEPEHASHPITTRSVLLSTFAIEEALDQAGLLAHKNIDLYYATTVGGIDISENLVESRLQGNEVDYAGFQYHDCGASSSLLRLLWLQPTEDMLYLPPALHQPIVLEKQHKIS
jgi:hypothetical protein